AEVVQLRGGTAQDGDRQDSEVCVARWESGHCQAVRVRQVAGGVRRAPEYPPYSQSKLVKLPSIHSFPTSSRIQHSLPDKAHMFTWRSEASQGRCVLYWERASCTQKDENIGVISLGNGWE